MPELLKANIEIVCDQSESLTASLTSVQHLSLCSKISNIPYRADSFFFSLQHLKLCTCSDEWWNLLYLILKDAPRLRLLKLNSIHCAHYSDPMDRWSQPSFVPECLSSHLEILEWRQYKGTKPDKQVAEYILANAGRLKMATFSSKSTEKHLMFNKLEYVLLCSKACQLLFD
uniref:Putative FBD-associated F-box protein n=1 Tax=Noccaea caerulescens TaxID=107243 RepID=A0A1J3GTK8_NOCCA